MKKLCLTLLGTLCLISNVFAAPKQLITHNRTNVETNAYIDGVIASQHPTKANSDNWVSKSIVIADGAFANKGPKNSDFSLVNEDNEDDVFHMIEIIKSNPKN